METTSPGKKPTAFEIWERTGITEHVGGIYATRELIQLCGIRQGQRVLDIGCGTGFTSCLLAKEYGASVVAIDLGRKLLGLTRERAAKEGVSSGVDLIQADAQNLPFKENVFDAAITESVLVFCDQPKVASEVYRLVKPGGVFGDNELTYLKPPTKELSAVFSEPILGVNVRLQSEEGWKAVLSDAGFKDVAATVHGISAWQQFRSHLKIDGLRKLLMSIVLGLSDPSILAPYLKWDVLKALIQALSYLGRGLYVARKTPD